MYDENYLAHYGILGMHWGIRRYQNKDGTYTAAGRKRRGFSDNARHGPSASKEQANRIKTEEKLRKEREENKKKALASGSASDVLKFRGELTNKELQDAINRIDYERKLSDAAKNDTKTFWDNLSPAADKLGKVVTLSGKMIEAWNVFAKISNAFSDNKLPIIGDNNKKEDNNKGRDAIIGKYMADNGRLDQILKYSSQMTEKDLSRALERIAAEEEEKTKKNKDKKKK